MLCRLSISNYALIRDLDINFNEPFSVITGETGAGKSIILGALSLMLGNRADNLVFPDKNRKCCIEGSFDVSKCEIESFFEENNLDYDTICIIRREITPQGKSRAFINDTPVNLNQLRELTERLIDVHSQHQTLLLRENSFQLSVVDAIADNRALLKTYTETYKRYTNLVKELEIAREANQKAKTELDYLLFVVDEFRKANLVPGELERLEEELDVHTHAEEIKVKLYNAAMMLMNDDENLVQRLKEVAVLVDGASRHYPEAKPLYERLDSCLVELRDIAEYINDASEKVTYSPDRIEQINERLNTIYKLLQKHHARDIAELMSIGDEHERKISGIDSLDNKIKELETAISGCYNDLTNLAADLSGRRRGVSGAIEQEIIGTISQLGIKDGSFRIEWKALDAPGKSGIDNVKFLFSANKGTEPDNIEKIASGGELSRLMLAVKSLISTNNLLPTIVFDEIDTGISGDIAGKVGGILRKISKNMQVITITHLPQIAALSNEHFKVLKLSDQASTWSVITKLSKEEQVSELAVMIGGDEKLQGAREAAQELLQKAAN
ncbi:MAG TPA: DNA repair protein RecN [Lentimicrobium sp.]|nr:DNA repair protein RecN [Lentimicrobium sp.]